MDPKYEFGTKEFYIEYGRKECIKKVQKRSIKAITKYLMENEHLSSEEANQKAKDIINGSF